MKTELLEFTSHTTQYSQQNITKELKITYKVREHISFYNVEATWGSELK